jgi:FtsP/CotA-like multicopper oxidase with cupredoxin domain
MGGPSGYAQRAQDGQTQPATALSVDWMFHCHILEHQESGMMGVIRVA